MRWLKNSVQAAHRIRFLHRRVVIKRLPCFHADKKACLNLLLQREPFLVGKWLSLHLAILGNLYFDFNSLRAFLIGGDLIDQALFVGIADDVYPMCAGIVQQRPVDWFGVLKAA